jgi:hypothetical protein
MYVKVLIAILLASAPAFAQHDHAHDDHHRGAADTAVSAGVALVAASYDTMFYAGDYQGVVPNARWSTPRFAVIASGALHRLTKNGAEFFGLGDVGVHAQAVVARAETLELGVLAGISLPTGDERHGMGMGHVMLMPGVFAGWTVDRVRLAGSLGYSRALGGERDHDHGTWPLVSPMLLAELSWNAGADVRVSHAVTAGARASGGLPAGEGGRARSIVAGRVGWRRGRVDSAFELQGGVVGDPFTIRGVVSTALSF